MKEELYLELKKAMREEFLTTRGALDMTQETFAEHLYMSGRAYKKLESGESCCGFMTFLIFAGLYHRDPVALLARLIGIVERVTDVGVEGVVSRRWMARLKPARAVLYESRGKNRAYPVCDDCFAPIARDFQAFCGNCGRALDWEGYTEEAVPLT